VIGDDKCMLFTHLSKFFAFRVYFDLNSIPLINKSNKFQPQQFYYWFIFLQKFFDIALLSNTILPEKINDEAGGKEEQAQWNHNNSLCYNHVLSLLLRHK